MPASFNPVPADRVREARLRRIAARHGMRLSRSRLRGAAHADNHGGYMLTDALTGRVEAGERWDLDLDDVVRLLSA